MAPERPIVRYRLGVPRAIQACAALGVALSVAYFLLYLAVRGVEPAWASGMLRMYGLTMLAGREAAVFDALQDGMPLSLVIAVSVLDDVGTLLLALTFVWLGVQGLRRVARLRLWFLRLEKQALQNRAWVRRWGLAGLALFFFLPGFGSGVLAASILGIVFRLPVAQLAVTLSAASLAVDAIWAFALLAPARALAQQAWADWIPLGMVILVFGSSAVGLWRDRATRHVVLLDVEAAPTPAHAADLAGLGVRPLDGVVEADLRRLGEAVPSLAGDARLVFAAELLLLDGMRPAEVAALVAAGVKGLPDVARQDAAGLAALLGDARAGPSERLAGWPAAAAAMLGATRRAP